MTSKQPLYNLINGYYIRLLDSRNWIVAHPEKEVKGVNKGKMKEVIDGYYGSLPGAWNSAITKLVNLAESKTEIRSIIKKLEDLKIIIK